MNIMDLIETCVDQYETGTPIYSNNICKYVLDAYKTNTNIINEYINRYEEKHSDFIRFRKGIYYKAVNTPFGYSNIDYNKLIKGLYLSDNNHIYGYIGGPSLANKINLTTQIPKEEYIVTNNYRVLCGINNVKLIKPVTTITKDNYKVLQVLDLLSNKYDIIYDCENPNKIIHDYINENNISYEELICYSIFYNKNTLLKLQEVCLA